MEGYPLLVAFYLEKEMVRGEVSEKFLTISHMKKNFFQTTFLKNAPRAS